VFKNNKELTTIFLIVFIDLLGFGIILPLLPYIAERYSASPFQIGLLTASYSLFQFISGPILGSLSDRFGRKKLLVISQLGSMFGYILLGLAGSLPLLFFSRIVDGITGGNISIAQAYIADVTDKKSRAKGMGLLGAAFGLGFMLGPAIGGWLSNYGFAAPAFFAASIAAITSAATSLFLKETINIGKMSHSQKTSLSRANLQAILTTQPIGLLIISFFVLMLGFSGIQGTYALFVQYRFGWGPKEIGYIFALIGLIAVITQAKVVPIMVKKFGERNTLIFSLPVLILGFLIIPFAKVWPILLIANTLIPLGNGLAQPTISSIASENVDPEKYGYTLGVLQSSASLGRIFGPIIGGALFNAFTPSTPYFFSAVTLLFVYFLLYTTLKPQTFFQKILAKFQ